LDGKLDIVFNVSEGFDTFIYRPGGNLMVDNAGFIAGARCKAINVTTRVAPASILYKVGYYLWGADIWFGRVPVVKSLLLANIIVWVLLSVYG